MEGRLTKSKDRESWDLLRDSIKPSVLYLPKMYGFLGAATFSWPILSFHFFSGCFKSSTRALTEGGFIDHLLKFERVCQYLNIPSPKSFINEF